MVGTSPLTGIETNYNLKYPSLNKFPPSFFIEEESNYAHTF